MMCILYKDYTHFILLFSIGIAIDCIIYCVYYHVHVNFRKSLFEGGPKINIDKNNHTAETLAATLGVDYSQSHTFSNYWRVCLLSAVPQEEVPSNCGCPR